MQNQIEESLNMLSNTELEQCTDLQNALSLINKEQVVPESTALTKKDFIIKKKHECKNLQSIDLESKTNEELDEISDQADSAFEELMNIAINSSGKAAGDIASSAQSFLNIKLQTRLAKTELKLKRMKLELDKRKYEDSIKNESSNDDDSFCQDDGIIIINQ